MGIDADPVVPHAEHPLRPIALRADLHARRLGAPKLDRVPDEVGEQLPELHRVGQDRGERAAGERRPRLPGSGLEVFERGVEGGVRVGRNQRSGAGAHAREGEQVLDEPLHAHRPLHRELDEFPCVGVELVAIPAGEELHVAGDGPERLLEVVRGHVREPLELLVRAAELFFGPLAGADVDHGGEHEQPLVRLDRVQTDLDGDVGAVLAAPEQVPPGPHRAGLRIGEVRGPKLRMALAEARGDDPLDGLPQQRLPGIPEQPLGLAVDEHNLTAPVNHHHAVGHRFNHGAEARLARGRRGFESGAPARPQRLSTLTGHRPRQPPSR